MRKRLRDTRFAKAVQARAHAVARRMDVWYPHTPETNARVHAEVERLMGDELVQMVKREFEP